MNLDFIGEFSRHSLEFVYVTIDVEDLVADSIQAHDDVARNFNKDEVEGVLLVLLLSLFSHCLISGTLLS